MGERFDKLDKSFIDFLLSIKIIKNFFIQNDFNKNLIICNKIKNYIKKYDLDLIKGNFPDQFFYSVFKDLINEMITINEEIPKYFFLNVNSNILILI